MSLEFCILGSGSAGNCGVIRAADGNAVLLDAGLGPRTVARRLDGTGVRVADVGAICLTHLDRDHFSPGWVRTIVERGIAIFCHARRIDELLRIAGNHLRPHVRGFDAQAFDLLPGVTASAVPLEHDAAGSHGFVVASDGCRIGYATDLGRVPPYLVDRFCDLDILAIEANYDPHMELNSARPYFLKQRVMGGRGHLSNGQALDAVRRVMDRCRDGRLPAHVVLLHRSRECNCPDLLRSLFSTDARIAPRLTLAHQHERTGWLAPTTHREPVVGEQLTLMYA